MYMRKKEIREKTDQELIASFVYANAEKVLSNYKTNEFDIITYNLIGEELIKREILTKENVESIYKTISF